jgi:hypothetical protein
MQNSWAASAPGCPTRPSRLGRHLHETNQHARVEHLVDFLSALVPETYRNSALVPDVPVLPHSQGFGMQRLEVVARLEIDSPNLAQ